jgi:hypothetical protein
VNTTCCIGTHKGIGYKSYNSLIPLSLLTGYNGIHNILQNLFDTIFNKRIFSAYTLYGGIKGTQETNKIGVLCPV